MKMKDLKDKTELELKTLVENSRIALQAMRFKVASREMTNVREIRKAKKTIAQALTILAKNK